MLATRADLSNAISVSPCVSFPKELPLLAEFTRRSFNPNVPFTHTQEGLTVASVPQRYGLSRLCYQAWANFDNAPLLKLSALQA